MAFRARILRLFQIRPRRYLLAGFSITLTLPAGRHRLVLEALSLSRKLGSVGWAGLRRERGRGAGPGS